MTDSKNLEKRLNILQYAIIAMLVIVITVPFFLSYQINESGTIVKELAIDNMVLLNGPEFCPGDRLFVRFDFTARGSGVVEEDATWFRTTPPRTIISSEVRRFILPGDFKRVVTRSWLIPLEHIQEETGIVVPIEPGNYQRIFALTSPTRGIIVDIERINFTIKENCP